MDTKGRLRETDAVFMLNVSLSSFPRAFSGASAVLARDKSRTGPPIKTFGGDALGCQAQISFSVGERTPINQLTEKFA